MRTSLPAGNADTLHARMALRVLLIDDDRRLSGLLIGYLAEHEVALTYASSGAEGLAQLRDGAFDAVLLDVMMPQMDGLEVLRRIRQRGAIPVIMLTARGDEADRVVGLELGADDYVPKPFSPRELLARLRAVLRRVQPRAQDERLSAGGIVAEIAARQAWVEGKEVELTGIEFDILIALLRRAGRVVPRHALLEQAGRDDATVGERTVDVHISKLRKKLGDDPRTPRRIRTVRGVGYVLTDESASGGNE
jgi:DNA-binding response OmpR family regulator